MLTLAKFFSKEIKCLHYANWTAFSLFWIARILLNGSYTRHNIFYFTPEKFWISVDG